MSCTNTSYRLLCCMTQSVYKLNKVQVPFSLKSGCIPEVKSRAPGPESNPDPHLLHIPVTVSETDPVRLNPVGGRVPGTSLTRNGMRSWVVSHLERLHPGRTDQILGFNWRMNRLKEIPSVIINNRTPRNVSRDTDHVPFVNYTDYLV